MKCRNCGANYYDDEKECPMCGTKAGRGGRSATPQYTTYTHKETGTKTGRPAQQARPAAPVGRPASRSIGGRAVGSLIGTGLVLLFALLANVVPAVVGSVQDVQESAGALPFTDATPVPDTDGGIYGEDGFVWFPLLEGRWMLARADGSAVYLTVSGEDGSYALSYQNDRWTHTESGSLYLWYNDPAEGRYMTNEEFPPDLYRQYVLNLEAHEREDEGKIPASLAGVEKDGGMWLTVYESFETGEFTLNAMGQYGGLFPAGALLLQPALSA